MQQSINGIFSVPAFCRREETEGELALSTKGFGTVTNEDAIAMEMSRGSKNLRSRAGCAGETIARGKRNSRAF